MATTAAETVKVLGEASKKFAANKKNLFDLLLERPNLGVGESFTRALWKRPGIFWTVTSVSLTRTDHFKRGKVFGFYTYGFKSEKMPRLVTSTLKKEWFKYDPEYYNKFESPRHIYSFQQKLPRGPPKPLNPLYPLL